MRLVMAGVGLQIEDSMIVSGADLVVEPGEFVGLIGPNGSGKSTLLKAVFRALAPREGTVHLDGDDVWRLPARESARRTAVVSQERASDFDFSVAEVVAMGRVPHKRLLERANSTDANIVADALERTGMAALAGRVFATLSGGEKQRALIARALAQQSKVLVLDEPTNHLDISAQLELLELIQSLGVTTLAALHELNLAAAYCDRIYALKAGRVVGHGPVTEVLTPTLLLDVFGVEAHCGTHPVTGAFHLTYQLPGRNVQPEPERTPMPHSLSPADLVP